MGFDKSIVILRFAKNIVICLALDDRCIVIVDNRSIACAKKYDYLFGLAWRGQGMKSVVICVLFFL